MQKYVCIPIHVSKKINLTFLLKYSANVILICQKQAQGINWLYNMNNYLIHFRSWSVINILSYE